MKIVVSATLILIILSACDRSSFERSRKALNIPEPQEQYQVFITRDGQEIQIENSKPMSLHTKLESETLNELVGEL